jgi:hypothetical protein
MPYELKDDQVTIFKNDKKGNDKAPDYKGTAMVDGVEREVALWVMTGQKTGVKYFNGKITRKQTQHSAPAPQAPSNPIPPMPDGNDLPF